MTKEYKQLQDCESVIIKVILTINANNTFYFDQLKSLIGFLQENKERSINSENTSWGTIMESFSIFTKTEQMENYSGNMLDIYTA